MRTLNRLLLHLSRRFIGRPNTGSNVRQSFPKSWLKINADRFSESLKHLTPLVSTYQRKRGKTNFPGEENSARAFPLSELFHESELSSTSLLGRAHSDLTDRAKENKVEKPKHKRRQPFSPPLVFLWSAERSTVRERGEKLIRKCSSISIGTVAQSQRGLLVTNPLAAN